MVSRPWPADRGRRPDHGPAQSTTMPARRTGGQRAERPQGPLLPLFPGGRNAGPTGAEAGQAAQPGGSIHQPVMVQEVVEWLAPQPGGAFLDASASTGGHALAIGRHLTPGGLLVAVDWDESALEVACRRLADLDLRVVTIWGNFRDLTALVRSAGCEKFDGILLDLGVSSWALDDAARGFSFQRDGPLDMRMNRKMGLTAERLVNRYTKEELRRIFREEGEERWGGRIASAIVRRRAQRPIHTTGDLADIVARAVPRPRGRRRLHPATRAFMAIRATVNEEAANLGAVLPQLPALLRPGGRAAVLAYHSIEARAVKEAFRRQAREGLVRLLTKKPLRPTEAEQKDNPRSRSGRLRVVERL